MQAMTGIVSFSLAASATYIVNDILDLSYDRAHPSKRHRPFAAGTLSVQTGVVMAAVLGCAAFGCAAMLPGAFGVTLAAYVVLTLLYSVTFKRVPILDVVALATLYAIRLVAGGALAQVPLTGWFLGFSVFFFLSLALVKRVSEVSQRETEGRQNVPGRGYVTRDLPMLSGFGIASGIASTLVYCLYITGSDVGRLYAHPLRLWAGLPVLLYWLGRVWLLAGRGAMNEDPVVFALEDRISALTFLVF